LRLKHPVSLLAFSSVSKIAFGGFVLKVGLTGGVACGKSTILAMFERRGAFTIRADEIAHELMRPGQPVYDKVVSAFGEGILEADHTISRPRLAEIVFGNDRIAELNAIVHPEVVRYQNEWLEHCRWREQQAIAIVEAALMIEAGAHKTLDKLIVVTCSDEERVRRFQLRTGLDDQAARQEVARRMKNQLPESEKVKLADYVIDNSGNFEFAESQVGPIWGSLRQDEAKNR
jgi:dephospho-CoA kinase